MKHNEIDYNMIYKHTIVTSVEVISLVNIGSDHRMVRSKMQINTKLEREKLSSSEPEQLFKYPRPLFQHLK